MAHFSADEEGVIQGLLDRFCDNGHSLAELVRIERTVMPGYSGRVVPRPAKAGSGFEITMQLACCQPFTIAHELGHIADIAVRRQETRDHLSLNMSDHWHLAHRMSSEYIANRMACAYVSEKEIFGAFQSDHAGMISALHSGDWASLLISYALLLGLFHGLNRHDCDPIALLSKLGGSFPASVRKGMEGFRDRASEVFEATFFPKQADTLNPA